ncbi:Type III restriction enzyme, res subunit [Xanthomonas citri pv. fuscans]|uniref:Restriction endonuclease subunit R n=1 Tax=Xanthomonas campestris pv. phaseoli TaxID=317013 RepID=A0AB34QHT0_XANCH|nr:MULTISPECIES: DEAD/DEAH box helicase family protein [Gammaproteobacteria]ATS51873.1 DEAD/DEAH box helicase family protein [Xanthomonas citri pv. phaseoli var. fuscans]ATS80380.1 DEAD/DEAH box helicase family protein [Xanthomonas citri pv. phaseoli var. fuscans]KHS36986.1 restriction endonuclease subunit R [Xanthomonas phaseoli pv. phaseoli]QXG46081.1 DEAD/DEAH box helicase family protein [Pseudomonas viridiflava]SOO05434.1 Type III restriction enzyme, res subunit [Xanthomonas citri pv. fusc
MKLHFEDDLAYQMTAIASVVKLFRGQEISRSEFTVTYRPDSGPQASLGLAENELGVGNRLQLVDEELLENLHAIQLNNGLLPTGSLASGDFTVEMETGTGKTYVYLRTIFELNKNYGFTKFVIIVPSVAIKEGVYKTLEITREHFENLYPKAKGYEYFLYDSSKPEKVRSFAVSSNVQIMVATVGSINKKDVNNLYKENENTGGEKPIDLIKATNPIIIVDEPQSVDGGLQGQGKKALDAMNPLCTLRYSATHVDTHHMVYRLDAVDAYDQGLVKQIEVASIQIEGGNNKPYIKLESAHNRKGSITAKIEIDVQRGKKISRETLTVEDGDDLEQIANRAIYENMQIGSISWGKNKDSIQIKGPGIDDSLRPGESIGGVSPDEIKRLMIRRTIKEHFDKEITFAANKQSIKVLSLFFIDRVEHYRGYDEEGNAIKGKYATMFEEEYSKLAKSSDYQSLFKEIDLETNVAEIHNGYFSIDKKERLVDTAENTQAGRENSERAYNLIMQEKEKLLSFDTKLKFIFSHSALKEGWDNPNVFQICALRDMGSERERRQTIGRGLRLCVNQDGQRLRGSDINTLTVIATESYEEFAENLQKEIEDDTGIRFGIVEIHQFATVLIVNEEGEAAPIGVEQSDKIWKFLKVEGFVDAKGKVQDSLRTALKDGSFKLPDDIKAGLGSRAHIAEEDIQGILKKLAGKLDIKNADDRRVIRTREAVLRSEEFKALWERIKYKTTYRVDFNNGKLIADCAKAILDCPPITKTRAQFRKAHIAIGKGGVTAEETAASLFTTIHEDDIELPDIITDLQDKTQLTRSSIVRILTESRRLQDFARNPQQFIDYASEAINRTKRLALVAGIKYSKIGDEHFYAQELFQQEELKGYLKNTLETQKSVYSHVVYDSAGVEKAFAEDLEKNEAVKVYAKLPSWFKIPTPLGTYNPDWAVVVDDEGKEKLYFVVETKGSTWWGDLRHVEGAKILCGDKHFEEVAEDGNPARFIRSVDVNGMMSHINQN